ncbi:class I SAM-dependent methyltransferase [Aurantiacibacter sp. MUD11]|uniref:class I SAM-dependent methyltransferase n=1 Tax=Aurantiacibacter sp. MUD11 TaxID=3003265 RepID=UPI0022AAE017|nr:class I SAM-dependent methyltransferase [Aurantiacibacter sp. MUD11]WAT17352.1 class I SAM-dependent methyltransferase [Aurantiacibacter sp. MUD11]
MRYQRDAIASPCPVCGHGQGQVLYRRSAEEAAQHFVLREVQPERHARLTAAIARLWNGAEVALVECTGCGFVHAEPHVGGDMEFYTLAYERTTYPADKWEFRRSVEAIASDPKLRAIGLENVRVLELGAGMGNFTRMLVAAGLKPANITCTDYSEFGRQEIAKLGATALAKDYSALTPGDLPGPIHVACLFQVLEHLDRPHAVLAKFAELGTPDVKVLAAVPSDTRMAFNELNGSLLDMPPNHVGRYTKKAFEALAERGGWRLDALEYEPEGPAPKLKQFVKYRYLREMQESGTLANRVERMSASPVKIALRAGLGLAYTAAHASAAVKLATAGQLGNSQWVQLSRR